MKKNDYSFSKTVDLSFEEAQEKVSEELKKEGFGVLTEVDVQSTLKKKIGVDFKPYKILGACNPVFAHKVLKLDEQIGLMLPCNVVVYVNDEGKTVVSIIDPVASMLMINIPEICEIASEIRQKLKNVINGV